MVGSLLAKSATAVPEPLDDGHGACRIENPIILRGEVNAFGTHGRECALESGELTMEVTDRDGDYAICCVDLEAPLDLSKRARVCADVVSEHPERKVDVKLEVKDSSRQVFVAHEASLSGEKIWAHQLAPLEKKWKSNRICVASVGDGPTPNKLRLRSIGFAP
jgi:hypothetical protein